MNEMIVAEISKNWTNGQSPTLRLISEQFEDVIEINFQRGYKLHSFKINVYAPFPHTINETIIAVFERIHQS